MNLPLQLTSFVGCVCELTVVHCDRRFAEATMGLLQSFAHQAAIAVENV